MEWSVRRSQIPLEQRADPPRGHQMAQRQTLPVLPLRGTVIFPGLTAPIAAGRPGTLRAIEAALKGDRLVFAVAQRDNTDEPSAEILYSRSEERRVGKECRSRRSRNELKKETRS